jgi:2-phosphosulfolactate phosphatase
MTTGKKKQLDVILSPGEFDSLRKRDLSGSVCVVFDVLRATSSIVTALGNGAEAIMPVEEISEALDIKRKFPDLLLAGERHGVRIEGALSGGVPFDFGNSPREFTEEKVRGKRIVTTTTNGTLALRACAGAEMVLASSLLNIQATVEFLKKRTAPKLLLICAGTFDECAKEDVLGAGGICAQVFSSFDPEDVSDAANLARQSWKRDKEDLYRAVGSAKNGRRLLTRPELRDDVNFCAQLDVFDFAVVLGRDGWLRRSS